MSEHEPALADQFVESTYKIPQIMTKMSWIKNRHEIEPVMLNYRTALRRANRFVLSDDFVEMATAISATTTPDKMMARLPLAILPYETTWIEFDQHVKVAAILRAAKSNKEVNKKEVAKRGGLLLQRDINSATAWSLTNISSMMIDNNALTLCPHLASVIYDETEALKPFGGHSTISMLDTETGALTNWNSRQIRAAPWGYNVGAEHAEFDQVWTTLLTPSNSMYHLMRRAMPTISPLFNRVYSGLSKGSNRNAREIATRMSEAVTVDLQEFTGLLRWTMTVLALLSDVPMIQSVRTQHPGTRLVGTIDRPYFDYHRLSIKLPKVANKVRYLERRIDRNVIRHRAHDVRSHWRTYVSAQPCLRDQHAWVYDNEEHDRRHCERCQSHSTRSPQHVRGDPSLGWIRKDYVLEANKNVI